jgi:hypothetical protein
MIRRPLPTVKRSSGPRNGKNKFQFVCYLNFCEGNKIHSFFPVPEGVRIELRTIAPISRSNPQTRPDLIYTLLDLNNKLRKSYVKLTAGEKNDKLIISLLFTYNTLSKSANKLMQCTSKQHKCARFNLL